MSDATPLVQAVIARVCDGPGETSSLERRAAFASVGVPAGARVLLEKVTRHAYKVTDDDIDGALAAGLSEDQVFELAVAAALGQATRQLDAAVAALDAALQETP